MGKGALAKVVPHQHQERRASLEIPSPVTCRFTIDNTVDRVEIDDVDQTSNVVVGNPEWADWLRLKTVTFESNAVKLRVCGYDTVSNQPDYTRIAGFLMACDDGSFGTAWGDTVSDTSSDWSAVTYSDASFLTATSSPGAPVKSSSGFYCPGCGLSSTSRTPEKIWQGTTDAQYVCFTYTSPPSPPPPSPPPPPPPPSPLPPPPQLLPRPPPPRARATGALARRSHG